MRKIANGVAVCTLLGLVLAAQGCAPSTFIKGQSPGWKAIELNEGLVGDYDSAWMKTVDTIARQYDIEMMDKDSGYLRTGWAYGISGGSFTRYRGRITVKYPTVSKPDMIELKTEAQWLRKPNLGLWQPGFDVMFQRDVFEAIQGRLGRTVSE